MIPTVASVLNTYRSEGRINSEAAMRALSITEPNLMVLDPVVEFLLDCFMHINGRVAQYMKVGVTDDILKDDIRNTIDTVATWNENHGSTIKRVSNDVRKIRAYVVECARMNYENPKRRENTWSNRVRSRAKGLPDKCVSIITIKAPYNYAAAFISGMTDEQLDQVIEDYEKLTSSLLVCPAESTFYEAIKELGDKAADWAEAARESVFYEYHGSDGPAGIIAVSHLPILRDVHYSGLPADVTTIRAAVPPYSLDYKGIVEALSALFHKPVVFRVSTTKLPDWYTHLTLNGFSHVFAVDGREKNVLYLTTRE